MVDRLATVAAPLYVGRDNAVALVGREWRVVCDLAKALGVRPRRVGRVALYPAAELVAAIERAAPVTEPASADDTGRDEPTIEQLRAAGGKRLRAG